LGSWKNCGGGGYGTTFNSGQKKKTMTKKTSRGETIAEIR